MSNLDDTQCCLQCEDYARRIADLEEMVRAAQASWIDAVQGMNKRDERIADLEAELVTKSEMYTSARLRAKDLEAGTNE